MFCQDCGEKVASVIFTQIVNNTKTVLYLCKECAAKRGFQVSPTTPSPSPADLLAGMAEEAEEAELKCSSCGLTYLEFKKDGRLGCGDCYYAFSDKLRNLLRKIHGGNRHLGKSPVRDERSEVMRSIAQLREELKRAVEREEFERATELRDKISELERQIQSD